MTGVLVAHASKNGGTREIAEVVSEELRALGHRVDTLDAAAVEDVARYSAVVLGSALYFSRWRPSAVRLLKTHTTALRERPVWLFHSGPCRPVSVVRVPLPAGVALLAASVDAEPTMTFGGRLDTAAAHRLVPRLLGQRAGDYRDWTGIRTWARDIGQRITTHAWL
ncbi:MAG TPA: flavodoxin domain-containing protein [Amycolatopsis sp.]|jgi:menaquinone-dependent protoporphyrinogen oxidase|nr:flavodoxin domain-containing protein [Amycolatopsis sp.]